MILILLCIFTGILWIGTIAAGIGQYLTLFGVEDILLIELPIIGAYRVVPGFSRRMITIAGIASAMVYFTFHFF